MRYISVLFLLPSLALACDAERMVYSGGYVPAPAPEQPSAAVYIDIHNKGKTPITIKSISSDVADHVMIHRNQHHDHAVKMVHIDVLPILPGETVALKPGEDNMHIMLMGLKEPLSAGDTLTLSVIYDDGSESEVTGIPVKLPGT